jgi:hypothetical protein
VGQAGTVGMGPTLRVEVISSFLCPHCVTLINKLYMAHHRFYTFRIIDRQILLNMFVRVVSKGGGTSSFTGIAHSHNSHKRHRKQ